MAAVDAMVKPRRNPSLIKALLFAMRPQRRGKMETYDAHKTATEARQASPRLDNFWVLIISTAVVVAVFAIIFLVFTGTTPPSVPNP
jgi:hypothetical protein